VWAQTAPTDQLSSIFWEISGKQLKKPSYLFGTHHLYEYDFIEQNPEITRRLKQVEVVVGEIIVDSADVMTMLKMAKSMMLSEGSLGKLLSPEDFQATNECLQNTLGLSLDNPLIQKFKPIVLHQLISVAKYLKTEGKEPALQELPMEGLSNRGSMDAYFQKQGKVWGKELRGLESIDAQVGILYDSYPIDRQIEMLLDMVYDRDSSSTFEVLRLNQLYRQQNLDALHELMVQQSTDGELERLLYERNRNWIPQLDHWLATEKRRLFIAVGAGHLPGDQGVIALLRAKGYTLTPVSIAVYTGKE
jgi:uncharacterized protein YbaP (TraB family)